ncbi:MAG TPA: SDR family oxidoreductase [Candidatus Sulfotelmatobacter sp.]|jgi:NAD(P)-dependent dehydrogenase (short-subunit alcohol dehydrogenase family)|nr:SDR family oxidoreductase [Candidatus Sulfotelmatobacter sp.]
MPSVLITGANRGLGLEFARQYAADGWQVIATCRRPAEAAALNALGVEVLPLDVADWGQIAALGDELMARPIDLLLNNAGVYGDHQSLGVIEPESWMRTLACNTVAPIMLTQTLLPNLLAGRGQKVAFVTSLMGSIAENSSGAYYAYRSSKAALNAAVRSLSIDMKALGVTTLLLHPGWVQTDMGGASAPLKPAESVSGMRRVIETVGFANSGGFWDYSGKSQPW